MQSPIDRRTTRDDMGILSEIDECELCGEYTRCYDQRGFVVCRACQADLLP